MGAGKNRNFCQRRQVTVRDYGRGTFCKVVDVVSRMNTGGAYTRLKNLLDLMEWELGRQCIVNLF